MVLAERQLALTGLELRDQGIESLERHRWVDDARLAAVGICRELGLVTTDLLHNVMGPAPHPNAWGAVFHDKRFAWTGDWVQSQRPEAHARMIRIWRLR